MRRRVRRIEWRGRPQADGLERLGQAVRLIVDRAPGAIPPVEEAAVGADHCGDGDCREVEL
jgi:hypothetical protein